MASLSEVQVSLQNLMDTSVYPNGESNPSVTGGSKDIYIGIGWPQPGLLERVLPLGQSVISIFTPPHNERNVTRFFPTWMDKQVETKTLFFTVVGNQITISGTPNAGDIAVVLVNKDNLNTYSYTIVSGDTTDSVAIALAALIPGATAIDSVITVENSYDLIGRVSVQGTRIKEFKRQEKIFWIIVWAFTPTLRDSVCNAIDITIATTNYIDLPNDIEQARMIYKDLCEYDYLVKQQCYRRDFYVHVEYPTTVIQSDYTIEAIHTPTTISPV